MSEHLWVKGPFLSLFQDSGTPSRLTYRNSSVSTFRSKLKTHLFKLAFPPWILSHPIIGLPTRIWFLFFLYFLPYRMIPGIRHRALEVYYYYYYNTVTTHPTGLWAKFLNCAWAFTFNLSNINFIHSVFPSRQLLLLLFLTPEPDHRHTETFTAFHPTPL